MVAAILETFVVIDGSPELSNLTWVEGSTMGAGKDRHLTGGLTNQKARLNHMRSAKHVLGS